ncbi:unnamed protein product [Owenia fusiformis]|uniref:Uncharacterized protein n=1 Tax=Owenia fusiformis TaxID=6347 RepID=A0A8J1UUQ4_OWEFU|nr:unnamed protein product [Owenia fusiformis]
MGNHHLRALCEEHKEYRYTFQWVKGMTLSFESHLCGDRVHLNDEAINGPLFHGNETQGQHGIYAPQQCIDFMLTGCEMTMGCWTIAQSSSVNIISRSFTCCS